MDLCPIPEEIFSHLCMDFLELDPCEDVNKTVYDYFFVIVCRLSGYVIGIPCRKLGLNAETAARLFLQHVIAVF